jgi:hypothetical protein
LSTLNDARLRSPPTFSGCALRVLVTLMMLSSLAAVIWVVGWTFHALLRNSRITLPSNLAGAPTRTGANVGAVDPDGGGVSHGIAGLELGVEP